jgi:hypothetical protein
LPESLSLRNNKNNGAAVKTAAPFRWFLLDYCPVSLFLRSRLLTSGKGGHGISDTFKYVKEIHSFSAL